MEMHEIIEDLKRMGIGYWIVHNFLKLLYYEADVAFVAEREEDLQWLLFRVEKTAGTT